MKLTKRQLKQIIKEELKFVMNEGIQMTDAERDMHHGDPNPHGGVPPKASTDAPYGLSRLQNQSEEDSKSFSHLSPGQYTFSEIHSDSPRLLVYGKDGQKYFADNSRDQAEKTEDLITNSQYGLQADGYEGVGITGPNSHLR